MSYEIPAALVTGVCGILGGLAPSVAKAVLERPSLYPSSRRGAISGTWSGSGQDRFVEDNKEHLDFDLTLTFFVSGRRIRGLGDLHGANTKVAVECQGGFLTEDYMQFFYRSRDRTRKQMGVIVFRLDGQGKLISGHYAGLSPIREVFVSGEVKLSKIAGKSTG